MATPKKPAAVAPVVKAVPVVKPAAAKPTATAKKVAAPAKKAAAPKAKSPAKPSSKIGPEERYRMTEVAAYYIAERDGFGGNPSDYWIKAEAQINSLLKK
ncbi:DUF2934 domain-containing protein [Methyloradius palustris]|uniref:DUF2934 domain-containing protein n=1 Tax=Methyloradius palustris TaxID=2778876 RepID=A0A8D5GCA7_9PROT|nr:DUF2934 domain-containing protein [Methyloradius palustris]BCM24843.1 hypothetical protein ZMTM_11020 [Methyloradius palustris]